MLDLRLVIIAVTICEAHKILVVIPKMGYSHMKFLGCIADTLVDAGYDVVSLQPVIFPHVDNGTKKSRLIQIDVDEEMTKELVSSNREIQQHLWTASATNPIGVIEDYWKTKSFLKGKSENFDLGITELFDFAGMAVFEAIGLKNIVGADSHSSLMEGTAYAIGAPVIPSFMPGRLYFVTMLSDFSNFSY
ncbi:unnamed protein product [Cylicocyclus nassatus]|uniref:glucuronosyltransferase n=1 Tax=Cylicocyclus nassatus TaxID=53992 RepID=A0AA36H4V1_CYLNA|nr:unnamed protein product [Cylicocyclus nassatus]